MIDTDKYEGHSEGEWKVGARKGAMTVRDSNGEEIAATYSYPNARIMADAPLLLEEIKRLREGIEKALIPTDSNPIIHSLVKLSDLRYALKELIE